MSFADHSELPPLIPRETLMHQLFEWQAARLPDKPALFFEDQSLSYQKLDAWANRVAHKLRQEGAGPEIPIGVCMTRSVELIVALLAILKSGSFYLPLDPKYPTDRLLYMLDDSSAPLVLVDRAGAELLSRSRARHLELTPARNEAGPNKEPMFPGKPAQLAYVIYTSGSTGKPKGVMVEHGSVVNFLSAMRQELDLDEQGTWLSGTSVGFDISVLEIFGALSYGLSLVLLGASRLGGMAESPYSLPELMARYRVTHFQCTPAQARLLLADAKSRQSLTGLERLLVGGEALSVDLAQELARCVSGTLFNMYGPTETTVWSSAHRVSGQETLIPLGRPLANTEFHVLDPRQRLTPPGATGELYVGGAGVARGYLNRPELTRERFVPNPWGGPGERLYKTGDRVRLLDNGELEFLGRFDNQVKIRGHRIEPGEIEACLREQPEVAESVVVAQNGDSVAVRLVAYVTGKNQQRPDPRRLREHLQQRLPEHMLPAAIVPLDALPLTPNGKIDRKALPDPQAPTDHIPAAQPVLPRNDSERKLAEIWRAVLRPPTLSIEDNFFDSGGHSLLAVELFSRVKCQFGVELPIGVLFEAPTLAELARRIELEASVPNHPADSTHSRRIAEVLLPSANVEEFPSSLPASRSGFWTTVVPIHPHGSLPPFYCAAGIGGNPMNLRHLAHELGPDQPFYGLQHRGVDGKLSPHLSIEDMAGEYKEHIREVQPRGPYYLGGFSGGGAAAYELAQQLVAEGEQVAVLVLLDSESPSRRDYTREERLRGHLRRLLDEGPRYLAGRLLRRLELGLERALLAFSAAFAKFFPYRYRNQAVTVAFSRAHDHYVPRPYGGSVVLLRAEVRDSGDGLGSRFDHTNGWQPLIRGALEVFPVSGSHTSMVEQAHAGEMAGVLGRVLEQARERAHTPLHSMVRLKDPTSQALEPGLVPRRTRDYGT